ncbi:MAG: UDP-N-acetylmuramate dehydrogenase [Candidatus Wallbacteria bacterium]
MTEQVLKEKNSVKERKSYIDTIKKIETKLLTDNARVFYNEKMSGHTTFMIGGPADAYFEAYSPASITNIVKLARQNDIPYFFLGGGSNLLVNDNGIPGIVIKNKYKDIKIVNGDSPDFLIWKKINKQHEKMIDSNTVFVNVSTGTKLSELVDFACENGLSGCEYFAGIPGTVGGAIYGNAGAYGRSIGDILLFSTLLDSKGEIVCAPNEYFEFSYRFSKLKTNKDLVLSAMLKLTRGDKTAIKAQVEKIISERHQKHPPEQIGSAGSYFKNVAPCDPKHRRIAAGYFLDQAGVKGMKLGNASIYEKHANFIINPGGASANEVLTLAKTMKTKVLEKFGVLLEEEVLYIA